MDKPRIKVDFNECIEKDFVLLSKTDQRIDSEGNLVELYGGAEVSLFEFNHYEDGTREYLLAEGVAELNQLQVTPVAKWGCRINHNGIKVKNT